MWEEGTLGDLLPLDMVLSQGLCVVVTPLGEQHSLIVYMYIYVTDIVDHLNVPSPSAAWRINGVILLQGVQQETTRCRHPFAFKSSHKIGGLLSFAEMILKFH